MALAGATNAKERLMTSFRNPQSEIQMLASQFCPQMRIADVNGPHLLLQAAPFEAAEIVRAFVKETGRAS
jgi:hypothetical protein